MTCVFFHKKYLAIVILFILSVFYGLILASYLLFMTFCFLLYHITLLILQTKSKYIPTSIVRSHCGDRVVNPVSSLASVT